MKLCNHTGCVQMRPAYNDLIDYPVSSTFRDAFYEQGITPTPSLDYLTELRSAQTLSREPHNDSCTCEECWRRIESPQTQQSLEEGIGRLWAELRKLRREVRPQRPGVRKGMGSGGLTIG